MAQELRQSTGGEPEGRLADKYAFHLKHERGGMKEVILGSGSFGTVYKGYNKQTLKDVAIKVCDKIYANSLEAEIGLDLSKKPHKNIVQVLDTFDEEGKLKIISEFCNSGDLHTFWKSTRSLHTETKIRALFRQMICGYHYLRTLNIVHRDIKPLNMLIMIDETNRLSLKITDFGVSKMNAHQDEEMSTIIGSNRYMAPEMYEKGRKYDSQVDIWSMGIMLCEMMSADLMLRGEEFRQRAQRGEPLPINKGSDDFRDLVSKMLVWDPDQRITLDAIIHHKWVGPLSEEDLSTGLTCDATSYEEKDLSQTPNPSSFLSSLNPTPELAIPVGPKPFLETHTTTSHSSSSSTSLSSSPVNAQETSSLNVDSQQGTGTVYGYSRETFSNSQCFGSCLYDLLRHALSKDESYHTVARLAFHGESLDLMAMVNWYRVHLPASPLSIHDLEEFYMHKKTISNKVRLLLFLSDKFIDIFKGDGEIIRQLLELSRIDQANSLNGEVKKVEKLTILMCGLRRLQKIHKSISSASVSPNIAQSWSIWLSLKKEIVTNLLSGLSAHGLQLIDAGFPEQEVFNSQRSIPVLIDFCIELVSTSLAKYASNQAISSSPPIAGSIPAEFLSSSPSTSYLMQVMGKRQTSSSSSSSSSTLASNSFNLWHIAFFRAILILEFIVESLNPYLTNDPVIKNFAELLIKTFQEGLKSH